VFHLYLYQSSSAKKPQFSTRSRYSSSSSSHAECSPITPQDRPKNVPPAVLDEHACTPVVWSSRPAVMKRSGEDTFIRRTNESVNKGTHNSQKSADDADHCIDLLKGSSSLDKVSGQRQLKDTSRELHSTGRTMEFGGISVDRIRNSGLLTPEAKRCRYVPDVDISPHPCTTVIPKLDLDEDEVAVDAGQDMTPIASPACFVSTPHDCNTSTFCDCDGQSSKSSSTGNRQAAKFQMSLSVDHDFNETNPQHQEPCPLAKEPVPFTCQKVKPKVVTLHLSLPNCTLESDVSLAATPVKQNAKKFMVVLFWQ
jgi:hypothetical protein